MCQYLLASSPGDVKCHCLERLQGATGKEDSCPFTGKGAGDRTTDGSATVDNCILLLKQQAYLQVSPSLHRWS